MTLITCMACNSGQEGGGSRSGLILPKATGRISELLVVVEESWKTGPAGTALSSVFEKSMPGLPQDEPYFQVIPIKPSAFSKIFRTHRNLVVIEAGDSNYIRFKKEAYARGQEVVLIQAKNQDDFVKLMQKEGQEVLRHLYESELSRMRAGYKKLVDVGLNKKLKEMGMYIPIPKDFTPVITDENFLWLRRELPKGTQGILVFKQKFRSDLQMRPSRILALRDSLTKEQVKGEVDGSYMVTEYRYPTEVENYVVDEMYGLKIKGLWKMEGDFMGGPFLSLAVHNEEKGEIIFIDGFSYAPEMDKRNLSMQLEAILSGLELR